jgi:predicted ATP-grasp superfamily ATP-dependent carboligase
MTSTKTLFEKIKNPIIGASVQAFGRIGCENIFPNFKIACLNYSAEIEHIRKFGIPLFCLEESLKKIPKETKRNPFSVLKDKNAQSFIGLANKKNPPVILLYKSSSSLEFLAKKKGWILAANPISLEKKLENKVFFKKLLKKASLSGLLKKNITLAVLKKQGYNNASRIFSSVFVVQNPKRGGGGGTFFIKNKTDFATAITVLKKDQQLSWSSSVVVSPFVDGFSPSITGCVTKKKIFQIPPQLQLIDIQELFPQAKGQGVFCGHDWSEAFKIKKQIQGKMKRTVQQIGIALRKEGFRGIFGVDFIVDWKQKNVFPLELNPRLLGTFPVSTLIQLQKKEIPLVAFHVLEFLKQPLPRALYQKKETLSIKSPEKAHLFVRAPYKPAFIKGSLRAGVYCLKNKKLVFKRKGFSFSQIKNAKEFLIVDGVPSFPRKINKKDPGRIFRVVFSCQISQNMGTRLNAFGASVVKATYQSLHITQTHKAPHDHKKTFQRKTP